MSNDLITAGNLPNSNSLAFRSFVDSSGSFLIQTLQTSSLEFILHNFISINYSKNTVLKTGFDTFSNTFLIASFNGTNFSVVRLNLEEQDPPKRFAVLEPLSFLYNASLGELVDWSIFEGKLHVWYFQSKLLYYVTFEFTWNLD